MPFTLSHNLVLDHLSHHDKYLCLSLFDPHLLSLVAILSTSNVSFLIENSSGHSCVPFVPCSLRLFDAWIWFSGITKPAQVIEAETLTGTPKCWRQYTPEEVSCLREYTCVRGWVARVGWPYEWRPRRCEKVILRVPSKPSTHVYEKACSHREGFCWGDSRSSYIVLPFGYF